MDKVNAVLVTLGIGIAGVVLAIAVAIFLAYCFIVDPICDWAYKKI